MAFQTVSIAVSADIASVTLPRTKTSLIFPMVVAAQAVIGISGMHRKDYKKRKGAWEGPFLWAATTDENPKNPLGMRPYFACTDQKKGSERG